VFDRFDESARQVVVLSQDEARALKHNYVGTEHLLLALLRSDGLAKRVLDSFDVPIEDVQAHIVRIVGQDDEIEDGQIPFTPHALKALEHSLHEAVVHDHSEIRTEHLLLGVVGEEDGLAARVLRDFDVNPEMVRGEVYRAWAVEEPPRARSELHASAFDERSVPLIAFTRGSSGSALHITGSRVVETHRVVPDLWLGLALGAVIFAGGLVAGRLIRG
jgi:ATP-dependent Clp protease ATP-binding subunit ClpA